MSCLRAPALRVLTGISVFLFLFVYYNSPMPAPAPIDLPAPEEPFAGLRVVLSQASSGPPTVTVKVVNTNDFPVTVLAYNSPLDGLAVPLGMLLVQPAKARNILRLPTIQVERSGPDPEALLEIGPGDSMQQNIELRDPIPVEALGDKAKVVMRGKWTNVWPKPKAQVVGKAIDAVESGGESYHGDFASNPLEITITQTKKQ